MASLRRAHAIQTYASNTRKSHLLTFLFFCSWQCKGELPPFFSTKSSAHMIHAIHITYKPYSTNTTSPQIQHRYTIFVFLIFASSMWEGERSQMLQYHHEHTAYLLHNRSTSCVRTFTLHYEHDLVLVLLLCFSKQIKHTSEGELSRMLHKHLEHTAYVLHKRYIIHARKFTLR